MKIQIYCIVLALFSLHLQGAQKKAQEGLKKTAASKTSEQKPTVIPTKSQPAPVIKEQLPSGAELRRLLANPWKPQQDFSHFFDVMEIETVLGGKQMTREEIIATVSRKVKVYIGHTHMIGDSIKSWNSKHVPKIIELIFNALPKKPASVPIPAKPIAQPKQNPLPARNAQPFTAAAAAALSDDSDDDGFGYEIAD